MRYVSHNDIYSKTPLTDHLHRSTTPPQIDHSLYLGPKRSFVMIRKLTTSLHGPFKVGPIIGRFREVLLYIPPGKKSPCATDTGPHPGKAKWTRWHQWYSVVFQEYHNITITISNFPYGPLYSHNTLYITYVS